MRYLNVLSLVVVALVAAVLGWSINYAVSGQNQALLILPWGSLVAEGAAAAVLLYLGLRLRAYRDPEGEGGGVVEPRPTGNPTTPCGAWAPQRRRRLWRTTAH